MLQKSCLSIPYCNPPQGLRQRNCSAHCHSLQIEGYSSPSVFFVPEIEGSMNLQHSEEYSTPASPYFLLLQYAMHDSSVIFEPSA